MGKSPIFLKPTPMLRKQVGQFNKLFGLWPNSNKNKLRVIPPAQTDGKPTFLMASKGITTGHITRRQIVLNRHFTEIISDVLSVNLKKQLTDIGVTITSIESKAWNKGVNVFYSTDNKFESSLHQDLNSIISQLRYAISERRLIGKVPQVNFIYDTSSNLVNNLEAILTATKKNPPSLQTELTEASTNELKACKQYRDTKTDPLGRKFTAPDDMSNMMLGLDYPSLYNEVAAKLERGRGESSRMISYSSLASTARPFIKGPPPEVDEEDPTSRIIKMQKFLISQRKKTEIQAKVRRMEELLARDKVKWDWPEVQDKEEYKPDDNLDEKDNYEAL